MSILDPETHYSRFSQLLLAQARNELCIHFTLMHILMPKYTSNFNHCTCKN